MNAADDLVARLCFDYRPTSGQWGADTAIPFAVMREAAAALLAQAAEIERLRNLTPIAANAIPERVERLCRLGRAVEMQERMHVTSYRDGWNRCLARIHEDADRLLAAGEPT